MKWEFFMYLENQLIKLRSPEPYDLELIDRWENDQSLWHLSNTIAPISKHLLKQYIKSAHLDIYQVKQLRFMIDLQGSEARTAGSIDLFDFDPYHGRVGIGILVDKYYREQGIASSAIELIIPYCFEKLGVRQLFCNILESNDASLKLFQGFGFVICGKKEQWIRIDRKWEAEYMLQLLHQE